MVFLRFLSVVKEMDRMVPGGVHGGFVLRELYEDTLSWKWKMAESNGKCFFVRKRKVYSFDSFFNNFACCFPISYFGWTQLRTYSSLSVVLLP